MNLTVSSAPHIRGSVRTDRLMFDVVLALIPALVVGVAVLGLRALWVTLVSVATAVIAELVCGLLLKKKGTVLDGSAVVTGLLFAMTLPSSVPYYVAALGAATAIVAAKMLCGGLGQNIFNPALLARAAVMFVFAVDVTRYPLVDAMSGATPLHQMVMNSLPKESLWDMFLGNCSGSIGEISAAALLVGGIYLVMRKVISARIPVAYLATVAVLSLFFCKAGHPLVWSLYSLLGGGVMLGAIFMATDYVTSPVTKGGQIVYGIGCGVLTVLFRHVGLFPEGVTYAILLMNLCTWTLDRYTAPRVYGHGKGGARRA